MPHPVTILPPPSDPAKVFVDSSKLRDTNGQKPVESKDFPVVKGREDLKGDEVKLIPHTFLPNERESHLRRDIVDIGQELNNVNNDLYHVLNELLNSQSAGFAHTLYNLRAKDYNASLPDRKRPIKPLLNPSTGNAHEFFFRDHQTKKEPITVEDLEDLNDKEKEAILADLEMDQDFNYFHNAVPNLRNLEDITKATPEERTELTAEEAALVKEGDFTSDKVIAGYLETLTVGTTRTEVQEEYKTYLTTHLRIAVGLTRSFCNPI